ncbi:ACP S-malonyltransferase [Saccharothrix sp. NRRL B-16314]|uniref:ACP S-malonyltransferase n=1 Tax=Saccharothrix sp. NRRL B-16314 TaxID=1463825 RepID=UPI0005273F04|nr:ACP S-malonyltransferase [Saccharothrix sp. NRRL B-16314]
MTGAAPDAGTALVFPGMGPCPWESVAGLLTTDPVARELCALADDVLGYRVREAFRDAGDDYAEAVQVGFLISCLALADWAERELGVRPVVCAAPSFGLRSALAFTGVLSVADTITLTALLARSVSDYFDEHHRDVVTHSFARAPRDRVDELIADLAGRDEWCEISCTVDHDFHMVTLREHNLDWLRRRLRSIGALSLYTMRPPTHAPAFAPLRQRLDVEVLDRFAFGEPRVPLIADHDGAVVTTAGEVRALLLDGVIRSVRWPAVVTALRHLGIGAVCVAGPDSLFGRVPATTAHFRVIAAGPRAVTRQAGRA